MKTIALVAEKGGSGKTSIGVHLAAAAAKRGLSVAVIDLDPQGSASEWASRRSADAEPVTVVRAEPPELARLVSSAREQGAGVVIVDTAGRLDTVLHYALAAANVAVTPCRPTLFDLEAARRTSETIRKLGHAPHVVLNACPPIGKRAEQARAALEPFAMVAPVALTQLVAYSDALNDGRSVEELEPGGKAASEISKLYEWVMGQ